MLTKDENFKIIVAHLTDSLKVESFHMCFCNCQDYVDFIHLMMEAHNEDPDNTDGRRGTLYITFPNKTNPVLNLSIIHYSNIMQVTPMSTILMAKLRARYSFKKMGNKMT